MGSGTEGGGGGGGGEALVVVSSKSNKAVMASQKSESFMTLVVEGVVVAGLEGGTGRERYWRVAVSLALERLSLKLGRTGTCSGVCLFK